MSTGWAFKIDYATAIAEDEARIALYSSPMAVVISAALRSDEAERAAAARFPLAGLWFIFGDLALLRERMAIAGVSVDDLASYLAPRDAWASGDAEIEARVAAIRLLPWPASYESEKAGDVAWTRICDLPVVFEAKRLEIVRKAKASLARHKRNAAKWGGK
jgi:hypothetical protein